MEIWEDIKNYEGYYQISNKGRVKNVRSGRILVLLGKRYKYVHLSKNNIVETKKIHRLVAETFIPNPQNLPIVHHINGNNKDNRVENLMWATTLFNNSEKITRKRKSESLKGKIPYAAVEKAAKIMSKMVFQYTLDGELVGVYESTKQAGSINNCSSNGIATCCVGGFKRNNKWVNSLTYKGYRWSYNPL